MASSRSTRWAVSVVAVHAIVAGLHGVAHQRLEVTLSSIQTIFVAVVITLAPLVSLLFLWKGSRGTGGLLLATSMGGSLLFGVYYHFVEISPDHVSRIPEGPWGLVFQATAVLLAVVELAGVGIGGWIGLREQPG